MLKRTISLIMAVLLSLLLLLPAFAADAQSGALTQNLNWSFDGMALRISGSGDCVPDFSEEQPAPWHSFAGNVFYLYLPSSLRNIGANAFSGCANLAQVELPEHLETIGAQAFRDCGLQSLVLPYNLKSVGNDCFHACEELTTISFEVLQSGGLGVDRVDGLQTLGEGAFSFCKSLKALVLPQTIMEIGARAFEECDSLKEVRFEQGAKNLKRIGEQAFSNCTALTSFQLPESISVLESEVFRSTALSSMVLKNIKKIGASAFFNCDKLTKITLYDESCVLEGDEKTVPQNATLYFTSGAKNALAYAQKYKKSFVVLCVAGNTSHTFTKTVKKASSKADGQIQNVCKHCSYTTATKIYKIKSITLTTASFVYNAKIQAPTAKQLKVLDSAGKVIAATNYTVARVKSTDGKKVGKHAVKITFKGNYEGSFIRYYTIVPKGTSIKSVSAGKGSLKINWKKQATQTGGYQIRICKSAKFTSGVKTYRIKSPKTLTYLVKKLPRKTGYYIQIRTYKTVSGKNYCSAWSKSFPRKTK